MREGEKAIIGWEKIFANHISDKEFIPRTHKEILTLNNKKQRKQ